MFLLPIERPKGLSMKTGDNFMIKRGHLHDFLDVNWMQRKIKTTNDPLIQEKDRMKYMLLMYASESFVPKTPEEQQAVAPPVWFALMEEMKAAGVLLSNNGLSPVANATTVRIREGKTLITDGPFAETHEQLGGFFLLECKDLDEALHWAEKIPHAKYGSVEVRPLWSEV